MSERTYTRADVDDAREQGAIAALDLAIKHVDERVALLRAKRHGFKARAVREVAEILRRVLGDIVASRVKERMPS